MKNTDNFFKRRKVNIKDGWSFDEYYLIVDNILNYKIKTLEELIPFLNNKNLKQLINLLRTELKIGNKPLNIIKTCRNCNKILIKNMAEFEKNNYCNMKCRNEFKSSFYVGKNSPFYNRVLTKCCNCGSEIEISQYEKSRENSFGDEHHFCSQKCYWNYRSKYYVKEKHPSYNKIYTEKERNKFRAITINRIKNGLYPQTLTKPHKKVNYILDEMNIRYENEYNCKYYSIDIFLSDYNLMIEVMGDYWHASPIKYQNKNKLSDIQFKDIRKNKSKHTYIKRYYNIEILYLWEKDISDRENICKLLIKKYTEQNGILKDYNSFNYSNDFKINKNIIKPYFINN